MKPIHAKSAELVIKELGSHAQKGLVAQVVEERLREYGYNELREEERPRLLNIFFRQFKSSLVYVLVGAIVLSFLLGEYTESLIIAIILVINSVLGCLQEYKAEESLHALKKLSSRKARVLRDGVQLEINARELVPGDILLLQEGDHVPADARVFESVHIKTQESALTGESTSVEKTSQVLSEKAQLADQKNMVFSGTIVVSGHGSAVVCETGKTTELGKIAVLIKGTEERETPLQIKLNDLGKKIGIITLIITCIVVLSGVARGGFFFELLFAGVALAVAAIPEGLPAVVTISLAMGVQHMIKKRVLIRKLHAVETLGCTTVICTDKTGTLTCNEMTVKRLFVPGHSVEVTGEGYHSQGEFLHEGKKADLAIIELLLKMGVLNNNAVLDLQGSNHMGDPTETSLLVCAKKAGFDQNVLSKEAPRIDEIPFSSERKKMSTLHLIKNKKVLYTKGGVDVILHTCTSILDHGKVRKITPQDKKNIMKQNEAFASDALRVLACAYRPLAPKETFSERSESRLIFVGLQGMIDPPRPHVKDSIQRCKDAGIRVMMITGDHPLTAQAIGRQLGIGTRILTGVELEEEKNFDSVVEHIDIFARVNPEHKLKIVSALQKRGHVVAMTGDGVNDAPALKQSDIGVAMGMSGTEVAKEASDMIIMDDDFNSIVYAVEKGRGIYDNITKFVNFLLACNLGEVFVIFVGMLIGFKDPAGFFIVPLLAIQLLWINLLTDGLPALALSFDSAAPDIMKRKPRTLKQKLLTHHMQYMIFIIAALVCAGTLFAFNRGLSENVTMARTMAFTALVLLEIVVVAVIRREYRVPLFSNGWLIIALLSSVALHLLVLYTPLQEFFKTTSLGLTHWVYLFAMTGVVMLFTVILMRIMRLIKKSEVHM